MKVKPNHPIEVVLRNFKKEVEKSGIISDARNKAVYDPPSVRIRKKRAAARKRLIKTMKMKKRFAKFL